MTKGTQSKMTFQHLRDVNQNYWRHCRDALWIGCKLTACVPLIVVHAFLPNLFVNTVSETLRGIVSDVHDKYGEDEYYSD